jgi:hypothetical protein
MWTRAPAPSVTLTASAKPLERRDLGDQLFRVAADRRNDFSGDHETAGGQLLSKMVAACGPRAHLKARHGSMITLTKTKLLMQAASGSGCSKTPAQRRFRTQPERSFCT